MDHKALVETANYSGVLRLHFRKGFLDQSNFFKCILIFLTSTLCVKDGRIGGNVGKRERER